MPKKSVDQIRMGQIVSLRNSIRRDLRRLRKLSAETLQLLQGGAEIEHGPLYVEVDSRAKGGVIVTQLLVDGRPVEDFD